ncbi:MAG: sulfatase [Gemmatimonadota bacterium]|nr:sulfatase [Gemmatimonadota bacterium]
MAPSRLGVLCAVLLCSACSAPERAPPPNIVLIYADDLGWRDLSVQGSRYYETPNIDRLASEGMRFTNAYANAPNCAPSRAALLSGMYAPRTGIYTVGSAQRGREELRALVPVANETVLRLDVETIAEALSRAGYVSAHIGKWHLGSDGSLPKDQGFAWSIAGDQQGSPPGYFYPYETGDRYLRDLEQGVEGEYLADRLVDESIRFLEQHSGEPFFLYLSHYSVHTPIQGKADLIERYQDKPPADGQGNPAYAAMVQSVDDGVGRLITTLDRLGLTENTVVIFYSDNGGFGPVTSMAPLRGSKGMLYEGGLRVPLLVRWPGHVAPGSVTDTPAIGIDFYPTLMELAGATTGVGQPLDGMSLVPVIEGTGELPARDLFWHFPAYLQADRSVAGPWRTTPVSAIRRGHHKLLHFFEDDRWELYDLAGDESESRDLVLDMPELTNELQDGLRRWWRETGAFIPTEPNPTYSPQR